MVLVNGRVASEIAVTDRGLHYGDGLFETIAIFNEHPVPTLYCRHLKRLAEGCRRLGITIPRRAVLDREVARVCRGVLRGVLKVIVTRGSGGRGYRPAQPIQATRILSVYPWPNYPAFFAEDGITLRICRTLLGRNPVLAGMKHLNRLEQVLARGEWDDPLIPEGLMLDSEGEVIEGTMSNVFIFKNKRLLTPDLSQCGVAGIMRGFILEQATALGVKAAVRPLRLADIEQADEFFVCNSLIGLWPVRHLEGHHYSLGPLTQRLRRLLASQLPYPA